MSAVNVYVQSGAVHVVTDGAAFHDGGISPIVGMKAWPMPHANLVIAIRSPKLGAAHLVDAIGSVGHTYEQIKERIVPAFKGLCNVLAPMWAESPSGSMVDLIVAGWSAAKPQAYIVSNHDYYFAPWSVVPIIESSFLPGDPEMLQAIRAGLPATATSVDDLDIEAEAVRVLEIQRRIGAQIPNRVEKRSIVGGFVQLTSVMRDHIITRVLKRWPDAASAAKECPR